jgi:hypothetical protein
MEGAYDFLGNSANTDLIYQAKGEPGQALVSNPTLETNKYFSALNIFYFLKPYHSKGPIEGNGVELAGKREHRQF